MFGLLNTHDISIGVTINKLSSYNQITVIEMSHPETIFTNNTSKQNLKDINGNEMEKFLAAI